MYLYISTLRNKCAVYSVVVLCTALLSCFSGMLLRYFMNEFEMFLVARVITGINIYFYTIIIIKKYPVHELESSRKSFLEKVKLNSSVHSCLPQNICYIWRGYLWQYPAAVFSNKKLNI